MIFFFKQKTADEMRISDWRSDVCSSDLAFDNRPANADRGNRRPDRRSFGAVLERAARHETECALRHRRADRAGVARGIVNEAIDPDPGVRSDRDAGLVEQPPLGHAGGTGYDIVADRASLTHLVLVHYRVRRAALWRASGRGSSWRSG